MFWQLPIARSAALMLILPPPWFTTLWHRRRLFIVPSAFRYVHTFCNSLQPDQTKSFRLAVLFAKGSLI